METPNQQSPSRLFNLTAWLPLLWLAWRSLRVSCSWQFNFTAAIGWSGPSGCFLRRSSQPVLCFRPACAFYIGPSPAIFPDQVKPFKFRLPPLPRFPGLAVFFLGAARYQSTIPRVDAHYIAWYNDRDYELLVTGTLADPPDVRDTYTNLRLNVTSRQYRRRNPAGPRADPRPRPVRRRLALRGRGAPARPPENPASNEDFSYQDYLAHQGILAYMPDAAATLLPFTAGNPVLRLVYAFKDQAVEHVYRIFPDPEASLLAGILLGDDNGLPASLQQAYKNTGTAHIIAISGFNIAIIAGLFVFLFSRLLGRAQGGHRRRDRHPPSIPCWWGPPPRWCGPPSWEGWRSSPGSWAAARTVSIPWRSPPRSWPLINPHTLWDVGFQLSFAATLGLVLYAQPLQDWFTGLLARRLPPETARKIAAPVSACHALHPGRPIDHPADHGLPVRAHLAGFASSPTPSSCRSNRR